MSSTGPEYFVVFTTSAAKQLEALNRAVMIRVDECACSLAENPFGSGVVHLKGRSGYRIRRGDYRIIFFVDTAKKMVTIARIGHRREVYD